MSTTMKIAKCSLIAIAVSPLLPVFSLMWAAKGYQLLMDKNTARDLVAPSSWDLDTVVYLPNA